MVNRRVVETLLRISEAGETSAYSPALLAELCRAWLAVNGGALWYASRSGDVLELCQEDNGGLPVIVVHRDRLKPEAPHAHD